MFKWFNSQRPRPSGDAPQRWFFFEVLEKNGATRYHAVQGVSYAGALRGVQKRYPDMESCRPLPRREYHMKREAQHKKSRPTPETNDEPRHLNRRDPAELAHAKALGLTGRVTLTEIRTRYREQIAQYHPDKVSHLGPELREVAEKRTREIMDAWQFFKTKYGAGD